MKGKLLFITGTAVLVLLSGCAMPAGIIEDILPPGLAPPSEAEFTQQCGERGGEVCSADEVCRGSVTWSVGSPLGSYSCCNMTCGEITEDDECRTREDCDDGNSSTGDRCTGNPMKCVHFPQNCSGEGFTKICTGAPREYVRSTGGEEEFRENVGPPEVDSCAEVTCPENQRCSGGECMPIIVDTRATMPCGEQGGNICSINEVCRGSVSRASNSDYCCSTACEEIIEDECQTITTNPYMTEECDDGDSSTVDYCSGTPKRCIHILKICSGAYCTAPHPPI
ncbi:MAG: hypothetical protein ABIH20_01750 [Candidatus Diapherotrites archaeon]